MSDLDDQLDLLVWESVSGPRSALPPACRPEMPIPGAVDPGDRPRLSGQMRAVEHALRGQPGRRWTTLEMRDAVCRLTGKGASESSITAKFRVLRQQGLDVRSKRASDGIWRYWLHANPAA